MLYSEERRYNLIENIVAYILVRTDLHSLNPGKGMAQAHHAGVQMGTKHAKNSLVKKYIASGNEQGASNFNTTITLGATHSDIRQIKVFADLNKDLNFLYDEVIDPSYPFIMNADEFEFFKFCKIPGFDGKYINAKQVACVRPELTIAWYLGDANNPQFKNLFSKLLLHP